MPPNYSPAIPLDKNSNVKHGYSPAKVALASTTVENASASSILLLSHNTTEVVVAAVGLASVFAVAGKWISQANINSSVAATSVITSAAGGPNYDFLVPKDYLFNFVVPISTNPQVTSVQGVNRELGLFPGLALKTTSGNGSVLVIEY